MNVKLSHMVVFWGSIDLAYVLWVLVGDTHRGDIPFFSSLANDISDAHSFHGASFVALVVVGHMAKFSTLFSGMLMLASRKAGVYISLIQAPFRFFLIIPPTAFFIMAVETSSIGFRVTLFGFVFLVEVVKVYTEVMWLKDRSGRAPRGTGRPVSNQD